MRFILPILLLPGCQVYETIGITSTATHNAHVREAEQFAKDAVKNQARLVEITHELNQETVYLAKKNDDLAQLERAGKTGGKIAHAKEVSEELSSRNFSTAPEPTFDLASLIPMALSALGLGGPLGYMVLSQKSKIKQVAMEAIKNGESTEKNDTAHLRKLV